MNREYDDLEDKIQKEIRKSKVLRRELEIKAEKERGLDHAATIDTLEEITDVLSRAEIEKIAFLILLAVLFF